MNELTEEKINLEIKENQIEKGILDDLNWALKNYESFKDFKENSEDAVYEYWVFKGNDPEPFLPELDSFARKLWDKHVNRTFPF